MVDRSENLERLIIEPIQSNFGFMKHHVTGIGKGVPDTLTFLSNEINNPDGKFFVAYRRLENVDNAEPHVKQHTHSVDQMYCWIGESDDLTGLTVEVFLEDQSFTVTSPKSLLIPAGTKHAHRYVSGKGHFIGILLTNGSSYNEVTN